MPRSRAAAHHPAERSRTPTLHFHPRSSPHPGPGMGRPGSSPHPLAPSRPIRRFHPLSSAGERAGARGLAARGGGAAGAHRRRDSHVPGSGGLLSVGSGPPLDPGIMRRDSGPSPPPASPQGERAARLRLGIRRPVICSLWVGVGGGGSGPSPQARAVGLPRLPPLILKKKVLMLDPHDTQLRRLFRHYRLPPGPEPPARVPRACSWPRRRQLPRPRRPIVHAAPSTVPPAAGAHAHTLPRRARAGPGHGSA